MLNKMVCIICKIPKTLIDFDCRIINGEWEQSKICIDCSDVNRVVKCKKIIIIEPIAGEIWINLFNGKYAISNMGRVKSSQHGRQPKLMTPILGKRGYLSVKFDLNGYNIRKNIHRLIAENFIPNPMELPEVNHINEIKTDNRIDNLEWCTHLENMQHHAMMNKIRKISEKI